MRQKMKQLMGILLTLALALGLMAGMSLTAYADGTIYNPASEYTGYGTLETNDTTVEIEGVQYKDATVDWYVIGYDSAGKTVTLLSKQPFGTSKFNNSTGDGNKYEGSVVKGYVEGLTGAGKPLAGIKDALANVSVTDPSVTGKVPYLLNIKEAQDLSETKRKGNDWWLRSPGDYVIKAAFVHGASGGVSVYGNHVIVEFGVRPALQLDLSSSHLNQIHFS